MAYVIGIDTGGTYTDSVYLDTSKKGEESVERKAKALTYHSELEVSIENSLKGLRLTENEIRKIEKVVLSTTLATNAIVEKKIQKVGLIIIGNEPSGTLATQYVEKVRGGVNIKGRILTNIKKEEIVAALENLKGEVDAIAISGAASVRNPILEQEVKKLIRSIEDIPIICGHEIVSDLGYLERTNTAVINAGLLPIIHNFIEAIKKIMSKYNVVAPIFVVKGDGSIGKLESIKEKPIDTLLSGPSSSAIGTIALTNMKNAIVSDMGGTTTDIAIVEDKRVEIAKDGAIVGGWKVRIKSAKLNTVGLGGDSNISIVDGKVGIGPHRVMPACRGEELVVTPTDILHYTNEYVMWDREKAISAIETLAKKEGLSSESFVEKVVHAIIDKIYEENLGKIDNRQPICAIGAPSKSWYTKAQEKYKFDLIIPKHFEVANAVGAATAGIEEKVEAIVRCGEEGKGYLCHTAQGREYFESRIQAINKAIEVSKHEAEKRIKKQNLELDKIEVECKDMISDSLGIVYRKLELTEKLTIKQEVEDIKGFLETRVEVRVLGKIFEK